ncbi:MAG: hypothetical protein LIO52_03275, partial [Oscillospiraceae bacterium]|nr:hypothetical protein [Oscillospiraceae bacterium]
QKRTAQMISSRRQDMDQMFIEERKHTEQMFVEERKNTRQLLAEQKRDIIKETSAIMDGKINASENRMMAYFESEIMPKFNILAEGQQMIWDKMVSGDRVDKLEEDVSFLQTVSRIHSEQIAELKKAQ